MPARIELAEKGDEESEFDVEMELVGGQSQSAGDAPAADVDDVALPPRDQSILDGQFLRDLVRLPDGLIMGQGMRA